MKKIAILLIGLVLLVSCEKNKEYCWQIYDALGNEIMAVCGKTEDEMEDQYGDYFDRENATRYCWKIQSPGGTYSYPENITEKMATVFFPGAVTREKINCGYCQKWTSREKKLYKPNGSFQYSPVKMEIYCGDTCNTLFAGRVIILRDTPDSLISVEFLQKL